MRHDKYPAKTVEKSFSREISIDSNCISTEKIAQRKRKHFCPQGAYTQHLSCRANLVPKGICCPQSEARSVVINVGVRRCSLRKTIIVTGYEVGVVLHLSSDGEQALRRTLKRASGLWLRRHLP